MHGLGHCVWNDALAQDAAKWHAHILAQQTRGDGLIRYFVDGRDFLDHAREDDFRSERQNQLTWVKRTQRRLQTAITRFNHTHHLRLTDQRLFDEVLQVAENDDWLTHIHQIHRHGRLHLFRQNKALATHSAHDIFTWHGIFREEHGVAAAFTAGPCQSLCQKQLRWIADHFIFGCVESADKQDFSGRIAPHLIGQFQIAKHLIQRFRRHHAAANDTNQAIVTQAIAQKNQRITLAAHVVANNVNIFRTHKNLIIDFFHQGFIRMLHQFERQHLAIDEWFVFRLTQIKAAGINIALHHWVHKVRHIAVEVNVLTQHGR